MTSDGDILVAGERGGARDPVAPRGPSTGALLFGVFGPPVAWMIDLLTSITLHYDYCAALSGHTFRAWNGVTVALTMVGVAMLAFSLFAGASSWRMYAALGTDTGRGETVLDRRRFMARAGLITCGLFSFGIVLRLIAPLVLPAGYCGL